MPVIMLTACVERSRMERARDAGIAEFCAKPVTATELYRKGVAVIDAPRSFVGMDGYFGPDRRRRPDDDYPGAERREELLGSGPSVSRPLRASLVR